MKPYLTASSNLHFNRLQNKGRKPSTSYMLISCAQDIFATFFLSSVQFLVVTYIARQTFRIIKYKRASPWGGIYEKLCHWRERERENFSVINSFLLLWMALQYKNELDKKILTISHNATSTSLKKKHLKEYIIVVPIYKNL